MPFIIMQSKGIFVMLFIDNKYSIFRCMPLEDTFQWRTFTKSTMAHTSSIAFRNLPPNSARIGYATKRAPFISSQLSLDAVSALRNVWY